MSKTSSEIKAAMPVSVAADLATPVKAAVYRLKAVIDTIPHRQQREAGLGLWQRAYDAWQELQTYLEAQI